MNVRLLCVFSVTEKDRIRKVVFNPYARDQAFIA